MSKKIEGWITACDSPVNIYPELIKREPNESDNPFTIIDHILACRIFAPDLQQEWHEEYVCRVLFGVRSNNLDELLHIKHGSRTDSYHQWKRRTNTEEELVLNVERLVAQGHTLNGRDGNGAIELVAEHLGFPVDSVMKRYYKARKLRK